MSFVPLNWQDGAGGNTPLSAANLNRMEQGIVDAHDVTDLLAPLGPHVATILDSRIVDHNLDVTSPPNGYYVRWENGLQACLGRFTGNLSEDGSRQVQGITEYFKKASWTFPAEFINTNIALSVSFSGFDTHAGEYPGPSPLHSFTVQSTWQATTMIITVLDPDIDYVNIHVFASGRWK